MRSRIMHRIRSPNAKAPPHPPESDNVYRVGFGKSQLEVLAGCEEGISAPRKSGILWKYTNRVRGWKRRVFRLDNGVLTYYGLEDGDGNGVVGKSGDKEGEKDGRGRRKLRRMLKRASVGSGISVSSGNGKTEADRSAYFDAIQGAKRRVINVQFAVVSKNEGDEKAFVIDEGGSIFHCRGESRDERDEWVRACIESRKFFENLVRRATERAMKDQLSEKSHTIPSLEEGGVEGMLLNGVSADTAKSGGAGDREEHTVEDDSLIDAVNHRERLLGELNRVNQLLRKKLYKASDHKASKSGKLPPSESFREPSSGGKPDKCSCTCGNCSDSEGSELLETLRNLFPDVAIAQGLAALITWCIYTLNTDEQFFARLQRKARSSKRFDYILRNLCTSAHAQQRQESESLSSPDQSDDDEYYDARTRMYDSTSMLGKLDELEEPSPVAITMQNGVSSRISVGSSIFLGNQPVEIRTELPRRKADPPPVSVWSVVKDSVGKDLSRISIPVSLNEPLSFVQRLAEDIEYCELLDTASAARTSTERLLYVAAFVVSHYSSTRARPNKPFNSLLGQTFDLIRPDKGGPGGVRFIAEQVSHHPPVSACYAEGGPLKSQKSGLRWKYWNSIEVRNKFWGKSIEIYPTGWNQVELPDTKDLFCFEQVTACVHNIVVGRMWLDNYGEMEIVNKRTGDVATIKFQKTGWMSDSAKYGAVKGIVRDQSGNVKHRLKGNWTEELYEELPSGRNKLLWRARDRPVHGSNGYNMTSWGVSLNQEVEHEVMKYTVPTDSRLRPDQRALENGLFDEARKLKTALEDSQRERRKEMEALGQEYKPRWFNWVKDDVIGTHEWRYNGDYFEKKRAGDWADCPRIFENLRTSSG